MSPAGSAPELPALPTPLAAPRLMLIPLCRHLPQILQVEASSAYQGVGIVKLMGRQSGFITVQVIQAAFWVGRSGLLRTAKVHVHYAAGVQLVDRDEPLLHLPCDTGVGCRRFHSLAAPSTLCVLACVCAGIAGGGHCGRGSDP